jgi:hypothetical protein
MRARLRVLSPHPRTRQSAVRLPQRAQLPGVHHTQDQVDCPHREPGPVARGHLVDGRPDPSSWASGGFVNRGSRRRNTRGRERRCGREVGIVGSGPGTILDFSGSTAASAFTMGTRIYTRFYTSGDGCRRRVDAIAVETEV